MKQIATQQEIDKICTLVQGAKRILILAHQNPDGDALGSILGFTRWAEEISDATIIKVIPDAYPDFLQWLPKASTILRYDKKPDEIANLFAEADLVVCLDFNEYSRVAKMEQLLRDYHGSLIHIDHHLNPTLEADVVISQPNASSTCELVFKLVWQAGYFDKMDRFFHTPVFTGIMTDTGTFEYPNANPDTFSIAAELLNKGVDKAKIHRQVYDTFSLSRMRLYGYVLHKKLKVLRNLHASYFSLNREELERFHFIKGDAEGLVNIPLQLKGHKLSISLREDSQKDNLVWVSTRSIENVPCNKLCAEFFNGGGHLNAAGGKLLCSIQEAEKIAEQAIKDFENELTQV